MIKSILLWDRYTIFYEISENIVWSTELIFIQDPGHGWLKVPLPEIESMNIGKSISGYSYRDTQFAYLEEDLDYSVYMEVRRATGQPDPTFTVEYTEQFNRNKRSF